MSKLGIDSTSTDLMNSIKYKVVNLTEVVTVNPRRFGSPIQDNDTLSFVPMKAVEEETGKLDATEVRIWNDVKKGYTPFQENDVVFAKITPCMENGKFALAGSLLNGRAAGSTEFHVLRPSNQIVPRYLLHYLFQLKIRQGARMSMRGAAGQLRVPTTYFDSLKIRLPIIQTQHRIVAEIEEKLSHLDAAQSALLRAQANLKRYRASVLAQACHLDTVELPDGWKRSTVGELATVGTGATPKRDRADYWQDGTVAWVTSSAVNDALVTEASALITEKALKETNCKLYPPGTLIVAMYGEGKTRGMCGELGIAASTNQALAALQTTNQLRPYMKFALQAAYDNTRRAASGGVQPNLNLSLVRAIPIALPPTNQIKNIITETEIRLSTIDRTEASLRTQLERCKRLRQSILQRAFSAADQ